MVDFNVFFFSVFPHDSDTLKISNLYYEKQKIIDTIFILNYLLKNIDKRCKIRSVKI